MNRYPIPYSAYIIQNFEFSNHACMKDCDRPAPYCKAYWIPTDQAPNKNTMRKILATWQAFRNKPGCQASFLAHFNKISELVMPFNHHTLLCPWDEYMMANSYNQVREILSDSVVCTTKALHLFAPELFLILDREQVYRPWRNEIQGIFSLNPLRGSIDNIDGQRYVSFMKAVKEKLKWCLRNRMSLDLAGHSHGVISSVRELRLLSPMKSDSESGLPNTIAKTLDNLMRDSKYEE